MRFEIKIYKGDPGGGRFYRNCFTSADSIEAAAPRAAQAVKETIAVYGQADWQFTITGVDEEIIGKPIDFCRNERHPEYRRRR